MPSCPEVTSQMGDKYTEIVSVFTCADRLIPMLLSNLSSGQHPGFIGSIHLPDLLTPEQPIDTHLPAVKPAKSKSMASDAINNRNHKELV